MKIYPRPFLPYSVLSALFMSCVPRALEAGEDEVGKKIPSPRTDIPPLVIPVGKDVETRAEEGPDFIVFQLQKKHDGEVTVSFQSVSTI